LIQIKSNKFENKFLFYTEKIVFRKRYRERILDLKIIFNLKDIFIFE